MKLFPTAIIVAAFVAASAPHLSANETFEWEGGQPGFSAYITFDAAYGNQIVEGYISPDVVAASATTPYNTSVYNGEGVFGGNPSPLIWSPDGISEMSIIWFNDFYINPEFPDDPREIYDVLAAGGPGENAVVSAGDFFIHDFTGHWVDIPDGAPTVALLGIGLMTLAFVRNRSAKARVIVK